jgi:hypothetical protein
MYLIIHKTHRGWEFFDRAEKLDYAIWLCSHSNEDSRVLDTDINIHPNNLYGFRIVYERFAKSFELDWKHLGF